MAANFKLPLLQGEDATFVVTYRADDALVNLAGCTARMQAREDYDSAALFTLTSDDAITLGGVAGTITLEFSSALTKTFTWPVAVYDLEITFPSGRVKRLLQGTISVSPEVTRDD